MAMFGKKKDSPPPAAPADQKEIDVSDETNEDGGDLSAPPLKPFSRKGSHAPKPPTSSGMSPDVHRRPPEVPTTARRIDRARSIDSGSDQKRLIVGRDISLTGEITSCDRLVVEGQVEVTLPGARLIEVAPTGVFKGNADVEEADISGRFEGELIARGRLVVRAGGRVQGKIRYGRIVIEQGGEISGDMQTLDDEGA
ncbi:MAG: cell shape determination protein CcmA [Rhodospirillaceae bacterium]|nr:cell shape determination protein CcmA [Rhodospirillaceae bacterium]